MKAFVTLLSTANYLPGVLALRESLRRTGTTYPLLVALSCDAPKEVEDVLRRLNFSVFRFTERLKIPEIHRHTNGHWGNTFDKIQLFGLIAYEKLVYVDSDMMVLQNIDSLFDRPHLSATAAGKMLHPESDRLNSGLMVLCPSVELPDLIAQKLDAAINEVAQLGGHAVGDQDLINAYYSDWRNSPELHLPDSYNVFQYHIDQYIKNHRFTLAPMGTLGPEVIKIVHFIGAVKPWMKGARKKHYFSYIKRLGNAHYFHQAFRSYTNLIDEVSKLLVPTT